jgi:hypothetical protein
MYVWTPICCCLHLLLNLLLLLLLTAALGAAQDHVNRRWMGCHSDYGFAQTPRGFYANLVYNPSFANYGECDVNRGCVASSKVMGTPSDWHCSSGQGGRQGSDVWDAKLATASSSSARPSVNIEGDATRDAFIANRGVGNAGIYLEAGKPYEFQAYVWQDTTTTAFAELWNTRTNTSLARQEFQIETTGVINKPGPRSFCPSSEFPRPTAQRGERLSALMRLLSRPTLGRNLAHVQHDADALRRGGVRVHLVRQRSGDRLRGRCRGGRTPVSEVWA